MTPIRFPSKPDDRHPSGGHRSHERIPIRSQPGIESWTSRQYSANSERHRGSCQNAREHGTSDIQLARSADRIAVRGGAVSGLSDRQLLDRFVARRDAGGEAAFAALVARHGPMVLLVCRRLLGDHQHAEDAFQAVFLVLARRARSVRDPDLLSHWLYGVALRTARKAKVRVARQRQNERDKAMSGASPESGVPADRSVIDREQAELLHDEIERLPRDFRLPIVLCYFEGLPLDEAARRLRWREGTLRSRLARARDKLRRGLTRHGIVLPAATLAAVLDARPVSAALSFPLCAVTTRAAVDFAAGQAAAGGTASALAAIALAQEGQPTITWSRRSTKACS